MLSTKDCNTKRFNDSQTSQKSNIYFFLKSVLRPISPDWDQLVMQRDQSNKNADGFTKDVIKTLEKKEKCL